MSEAAGEAFPVKIRIPRLPGADVTDADASGKDAVPFANETNHLFTPAPEEADAQEPLPTPFNTALEDGETTSPAPLFGPLPVRESSQLIKLRMVVIYGHPRETSLCQSLAEAYADAAVANGHDVEWLRLHELDFDPNERGQELEPCLEEALLRIKEADHLVIVHPVWWGSAPALLKGFLDRVFRPGFAFRQRKEDGLWEGLLSGRTADLLVTMDTPPWIFRTLLGAPAIRALRDATFAFSGIKPTRTKSFGPVHQSTPAQRTKWLEQAARMGRSAAAWHHTGWHPKAHAWVQAARLPFYLYPLLVVVLGAFTAGTVSAAPLHGSALALACLAVVLIEFITVLTNDLHDGATDARNQNHGPFTGGSRVLVEGRLTIPQVLRGRNVALALLLGTMVALYFVGAAQAGPVALLIGLGLTAGLGYSTPPLRLASRGCGEITVALTHGLLCLLIGYASQAGSMRNLIPWALALPVTAAVLPAILLAGLPDLEADSEVGKRTLAVRLGRRRLVKLALVATLLATLVHIATLPFGGWLLTAPLVLHAVWLGRGLLDHLARPHGGRVDGLLFRALTFMLWFVLAPLLG